MEKYGDMFKAKKVGKKAKTADSSDNDSNEGEADDNDDDYIEISSLLQTRTVYIDSVIKFGLRICHCDKRV